MPFQAEVAQAGMGEGQSLPVARGVVVGECAEIFQVGQMRSVAGGEDDGVCGLACAVGPDGGGAVEAGEHGSGGGVVGGEGGAVAAGVEDGLGWWVGDESTRRLGERGKGRDWYESTLLPRIGPWALYGLLFTIVILFALQGKQITSQPLDVVRIAIPLLAYFAIMWGGGYLLGASLGLGYERTTTLAFTAAGNNFELAIAVAIATYGAASGQALAGVVGPLIEVPVLVGLVYVSLALRTRFGASGTAATVSSGVAEEKVLER